MNREQMTDAEINWTPLDPVDWPHTPPLSVYRELAETDRTLFWKMSTGHAQNLLDEAIDRLEQVEKLAESNGIWKGRRHFRGLSGWGTACKSLGPTSWSMTSAPRWQVRSPAMADHRIIQHLTPEDDPINVRINAEIDRVVAELAERIEKVLALHVQVDRSGENWCDTDDQEWPCETVKILTGEEASDG